MITDVEREFLGDWHKQTNHSVVLPVTKVLATIVSWILGALLFAGIKGYDFGRKYLETPRNKKAQA